MLDTGKRELGEIEAPNSNEDAKSTSCLRASCRYVTGQIKLPLTPTISNETCADSDFSLKGAIILFSPNNNNNNNNNSDNNNSSLLLGADSLAGWLAGWQAR